MTCLNMNSDSDVPLFNTQFSKKRLTIHTEDVLQFCEDLEHFLLHGMNTKLIERNSESISFWPVVEHSLTDSDRDRLLNLSHINSEIGLARAWIRMCLNDNLLLSYLIAIIDNKTMLREFYDPHAFILNPKKTSALYETVQDISDYSGAALEINLRSLNTPVQQLPVEGYHPHNDTRKTTEHQLHNGATAAEAPDYRNEYDLSEEDRRASPLRRQLSSSGSFPDKEAFHFIDPRLRASYPTVSSSCQSDCDSECSEEGEGGVGSEVLVPLTCAEQNCTLLSLTSNDVSDLERPMPHLVTTQRSEASLEESFSSTDLKMTLVDLIDQKQSLASKNSELSKKLEKEQLRLSTMEEQMTEMQNSVDSRQESDNIVIKGLRRETDILKHQLKKYITTVQLLRPAGPHSNSSTAAAAAGGHQQRQRRPPEEVIEETEAYERQLVELAQLHAELLEVNDRVHRELFAKEARIRALSQQIEEIRGPLADVTFSCSISGIRSVLVGGSSSGGTTSSAGAQNEDNSDMSVYPTNRSTTAPQSSDVTKLTTNQAQARQQVSVNLWIPCAFLRGTGNEAHHVFQVYIRVGDDEWNVYRRYSEFHSLHCHLRDCTSWADQLDFPGKRAIGRRTERVVEDRRRRLQTYTRHVVRAVVRAMEARGEGVAGLGGVGGRTGRSAKASFIHWIPFLSDGPMAGAKPNPTQQPQQLQLYDGL